MKSQKVYTIYSIILWFFWLLVLILLQFSGNCYNIKNEQLFAIVSDISAYVWAVSMLPILPVMWVIAMVKSLKQKKLILFNILSMIFSVMLCFYFFIIVLCWVNGA